MEKKPSSTNRILIATNLIAIGLAAYFFYQTTQTSKSGTDTPPTACAVYEDLKGEPWDHFKNAVNNYYQNIYPAINARMEQIRTMPAGSRFEDARAIWFSMDTLKQFLYTIEKYSGYMNIPSSQLGVRLYYGQYDRNHTDYPDRHTLFMVPTFAHDQTETAIDFDPRFNYNVLNVRTIDSVRSLKRVAEGAPATTEFSILGASNVADPSIRNSGELCPPKCLDINNNIFFLTDH